MGSQLILLLFCIIWYFSRGLRKDNHIWTINLWHCLGLSRLRHKSVNFHPHILLYVIIKFKFSLNFIFNAVTVQSIRWYIVAACAAGVNCWIPTFHDRPDFPVVLPPDQTGYQWAQSHCCCKKFLAEATSWGKCSYFSNGLNTMEFEGCKDPLTWNMHSSKVLLSSLHPSLSIS